MATSIGAVPMDAPGAKATPGHVGAPAEEADAAGSSRSEPVAKKVPAAEPKLVRLSIYPPRIALEHQADVQRVLIVGTYDTGQTRHLSRKAKITIEPGGICGRAIGEGGRDAPLFVEPRANGEATLRATVGDVSAEAAVVVSGVEAPRPVSFRNDVLPVFMKAGCNSGSCHGSAEGKNGFRLSLFGFEPGKDYISLTRDMASRRINLANPRDSLMLRKPLGEADHEGGQRLDPDGEMMDILLRWIDADVPDDPPNLQALTEIEVLPKRCVLYGRGAAQPLIVRAVYADGTDRDVTSLAVFDASDPLTAAVSGGGRVTAGAKGESYVMVRFGSFAVVSQIITLPEAEAFTWPGAVPANFIDEAIFAKLRILHVAPSPPSDDAMFVRRVYLDVLGLLPTVEETRAFLVDTSPDKRARLIDALLERPEFPELWAMKWAEMLRIESGSRRLSFKAMYRYNEWLRAAIRANMPMDRMVRELLTAQGGNFRNPPANFYLVETSPTLMGENVSQVFLGVRIQCSQCHNHPFERWTQDDYYSFAAFFSQVGTKGTDDPRERVVFNRGGGEVRHLRTGQVMAPKLLGGAVPDVKGKDRRAVLAEWVTSPDNPYFAACFVDRVWAHFLGRGLVDPPDDARVSNPPSHPGLRRQLAATFIQSGYDLRGLVRLICNSYTYQASSVPTEANAADRRNFSHAMVRRLPAEVLLDAVCQVTGVPEKFSGLPLGARAMQVADARSGSYFLDVFGRPPRLSACTCERRDEPTLSQALHLINGPTISAKVHNDQGRLAKALAGGESPEMIIDALFLGALCRAPTEAERSVLLKAVAEAKDKRAAIEDIAWAVLNSKEFVFNH